MITQLMSVEAAPQTRLKNKVSTAQTAVASYQSVNSKISAFKSAADSLSQLSSWRSLKVASSSSTVSATSSSNYANTTGSLTFNVTAVAAKQSTTMAVTTYADDDGDGTVDTTPHKITSATTISVQPGSYDTNGVFTSSGAAVDVDISKDQSAQGIATAINGANVGALAYVMKTSNTTGVLQINGSKSGAGNGFQIAGLDNAPENNYASLSSTPPASATVQVSGGGGQTYSVNSDTNTFTGLMTGVTVTVTKVENNVTLDASTDQDAIAGQFQALVDAANASLTEIAGQTAYDASTKTGSPLTGDFSVRNMQQRILSAVSSGLSYTDDTTTPSSTVKFGSLAKFGIQLNSTGQLTFDKSKFMSAYTDDPVGIQKAGIALGDQMESLGTAMTTNLTSVITGRNSEIDYLNDQISNWDVRLVTKKEALQKQYADLEVSLGKLKDQSSWLSGQLAGLS
jgi:flagellar hook-associated protein 2